MTAPDFTGWREPWPLTPTLHQLTEPRSVIVDINRTLPLAKYAQRPDRLPLRVIAGGLRLEATMPGKLHAWARLVDGQWLACTLLTPSHVQLMRQGLPHRDRDIILE